MHYDDYKGMNYNVYANECVSKIPMLLIMKNIRASFSTYSIPNFTMLLALL